MSWHDQISKASFRGAPFGVSGDDKEGGRRTVVHEFPQRDEVYVEDLGAAATRFTVQAFVLGPDYMSQRDALEKALAEPGPGTLAHPWYGEITVSQFAPYKVKHTAQDGGMCVFTLSFARDAEPSSPDAAIDAQGRALNKAGLSGIMACDAFDAVFTVAGQTAHVVQQAYQSVTNAVARAQAILGGDINEIAGLLGAVTGYDFLPWVSAGRNLWNVFQALGSATGQDRAKLALGWQKVAAQKISIPQAENPGYSRARIIANDEAVNNFVRQIAVVEAARSMALTLPESRSQAEDLREGFMDALDALMVEEGGRAGPSAAPLPDNLYVSLTETRAATLASLAEAARSAPEIINYTPAAVLPSLAICHRLAGDISLETDLVARNRIIHPGFVPAEKLEALIYE